MSSCQLEMACAANMTGLLPDVPGMHCPRLLLDDVAGTLCPSEHGGILSRPGAIDMVNCADAETGEVLEPHLSNGEWVVIRSDNPVATKKLARSAPVSKDGAVHAALPAVPPGGPGDADHDRAGGDHGTIDHRTAADAGSRRRRHREAGPESGRDARWHDRHGGARRDRGGTSSGTGLAAALPHWPSGVTLANDVAAGSVVTYRDLTRPGDSFAWTLRQLQDATVW